MNKKRIIIIISIVVALVLVMGVVATVPLFLNRSDSQQASEQITKPGIVTQETTNNIENVSKQWLGTRDKDSAIKQLDSALANAKTSEDKQAIQSFKYKVYIESGDVDAAISVSQQLVEVNKTATSYDRLAQAYAAKADNKAALENYKLARQIVEASNVPDKQMELEYYDSIIKDLESKVQ